MGILLLYDVTDEASFNNIRNWMRNIEQHASDNVNKVRRAPCARSEPTPCTTSAGQTLLQQRLHGVGWMQCATRRGPHCF